MSCYCQGPYSLSYPFSNYSDIISPDGSAELAFSGNQGNAAVYKDSGVYRSTFFGYPFEAISPSSERNTVMQTILDWCSGGVTTGILEGTVVDHRTGTGISGATITANNGSIQRVTTTNASGGYSMTLLVDTYDVTASATNYLSNTVTAVSIVTDTTTVKNFALQGSSLTYNPAEIKHTIQISNVISTTVTVMNSGPLPIDFNVHIQHMMSSTVQLTDAMIEQAMSFANPSVSDAEVAPTSLLLEQLNVGDLLFQIDAGSTTGSVVLLGVEYVNGFYFVTAAGVSSSSEDNMLYQLDANGTVLNSWTQPTSSTWGWRDLAFDGTYLYASDSSVIQQIDPNTGQATGVTIPSPQNPGRALAYDPATDTFWVANYSSSIYQIDRSGNVLNTFSNSLNIYGLAWDKWSPGGPYLWAWSQDGSTTHLATQIDPSTGTLTGVSFEGVSIGTGGSAGGATISPIGGQLVFVGMHQTSPDTIAGYDLDLLVSSTEWASAVPNSGTLPPNSSTTFEMVFDASKVNKLGDYTAELFFSGNFVNHPATMPLTMTVVNANPPVISDVRTTNVRDVAFTVSWLTDYATTGEVRYGTDPSNLNQTADDVRGASTSDDTHYVLLENLLPETTYYFDVVSGNTTDDNGGSHYSVTTGPTLGVPGSDTIFGEVKKSDGTMPAAGAILYLTLSDADGSGTSGQAAPLSALVENDGYWSTNLGNVRTEDLSAYFSYSASGNQLYLEAQGAADGEGCQTVNTSADSPAATIELGNSPCIWDIHLQQGWNKIALPLSPTNSISAQSLCSQISSIKEIDRWNAGGWQGHICGQPFNNFTLEMNSGYFIKSDGVTTWTVQGLPMSSATLNLQIGWNSISLPHTDGYTAESLCQKIISQGVTAVEIDRWNAGGWEGHICGLPFNDFNIERGKGYFVKTTSAGTVTPPPVASPRAEPQEAVPEVGQAMPVRDLVVSNLRDTSVTLSWTTKEATTGYVRVTSPPSAPRNSRADEEWVVYDIRGANTNSTTHYVVLDKLSPETTYDIEIVSGADTAQSIAITTAATLDSLAQPDTIYGLAYQADGVTPATDALVYLTVQDADGVGSDGKAKLLSALVDAEGFWYANLGNARTAALDAYFNYSAQGDQVHLDVQGSDGHTATLTVDTANDTQTSDIYVNLSPTAVEITNYNAKPANTPWQAGVLLVTFLLTAARWWYRKK